MYPQALYPKTKQVLEKTAATAKKFNFYLAGGTALALQLGHRKSIDLDFFSADFPKRDLLLQSLSTLKPTVIQEAPGTLDLMIDNVQVSFLEYKYPLLAKTLSFENLKLASILDIACMKLSAISSRGSKKDYLDLFVIFKIYSLSALLENFKKKFKGVEYQSLHLLKSLTYFKDADQEPDPDLLEKINWNLVKQTLEKEVKKFLEKNL